MKILGSFLIAAVAASAVWAAPVAAPADRFAAELSVFARQNALPNEPAGGTLFLGSSSVRLWTRVDHLPAADGINRGFGGATTPEVLRAYPTLIGDFTPTSVIVYVGENDIADGRAPQMVADDVLELLARVRRDFPRARIAYLSMKPSPARFALWPRMGDVNARISEAAATGSFDYVDVATPLLAGGAPDPALYGADGLHMNAEGYARWNAIVGRYLAPAPRNTLTAARQVS